MATSAKLPNGNPAIRLPNGDLADPAYFTVSNLVRVGPDEYAAMVEWVEGERAKRAALAEAREEELRRFSEAQQVGIEQRHAGQVAWAKRENL
jgi:hypothetical protein